MPESLYGVLLIIASLRNVPFAGYATALANGRLIFAQRPGVLVVTESWNWRTKRALRRSAPASFRWHTALGQSVMVGWDSSRYKLVWKKRIKGGASPSIRRVTDRRDLFVVCLEDRETGRRFVLVGVHTSPLPTKKAPDLVSVARRSHAHAADNIEFIQHSTGYPTATAGDFNTDELVVPNDLRIGPGITHAECFNGTNAAFGRSHAETFPLRSDHPGVVVDLRLVAA